LISSALPAFHPALARRPLVIALAGPNGAGKSSFYDSQLADMRLRFVNADQLALATGIDPYDAAAVADKVRRQLVAQKESFVFETVFSDPVGDKLEFLKSAERNGYTVLLIFIGIDSPEKSDQRVTMRVSQGGHDVPVDKLTERFPRVMYNLQRALIELANVQVYDNSNLDAKYRLVATRLNGQAIEMHGPTPKWLQSLLP
jgi:predicted ABC-type ATPase